jgi:hypothetical protein
METSRRRSRSCNPNPSRLHLVLYEAVIGAAMKQSATTREEVKVDRGVFLVPRAGLDI